MALPIGILHLNIEDLLFFVFLVFSRNILIVYKDLLLNRKNTISSGVTIRHNRGLRFTIANVKFSFGWLKRVCMEETTRLNSTITDADKRQIKTRHSYICLVY